MTKHEHTSHSKEHHKHAEHSHKKPKKGCHGISAHSWAIIAIIAVILLAVSIFTDGFSSLTEKELSSEDAKNKVVDYVNTNLLQPGNSASIKSITEEGELYKAELEVNGQTFTSYITKDGKFLFPQGIDLNEPVEPPEQPAEAQQAPADVPKSDKPVVELFVMTHCPFGTQAEKGMLPVAKLLGDKIDFSIKFVDYAMHGKRELDEQLVHYCVQEEQPEKYNDFLFCFLSGTSGTDEESIACREKVGIDEDKLQACVKATDEEFKVTELFGDKSTWSGGRYPQFNVHKDLNDKYGVQGSPSLIINGVQSNAGRSPSSYLAGICNSFNEQPEECNEEVPSASPSPGFGLGSSGDTDIAAACGA
ncbi:hypothetical protein ACFL0W_00375 [Nanoarchaeota archaeon]